MYEHNALGYWLGLALCLTKVRSSRARCPATALIFFLFTCIKPYILDTIFKFKHNKWVPFARKMNDFYSGNKGD